MKPFVKRQKNDAAGVAMMLFVAVKNEAEQAAAPSFVTCLGNGNHTISTPSRSNRNLSAVSDERNPAPRCTVAELSQRRSDPAGELFIITYAAGEIAVHFVTKLFLAAVSARRGFAAPSA